ncbi:MAG TPA: hypothetical protein VGM90_13970 [Kofleriaceae bacterium]|jgi:hypothetical protein
MRYALMFLAVAACRWEPPAPTARVRRGAIAGELLTPLASPPTICAAVEGTCDTKLLASVRTQARMELELAGMSLMDAERINAERRVRTHTESESENTRVVTDDLGGRDERVTTATAESSTTLGRTWADLATSEQRELLVESGFKGLILSRVDLGEPRGLGGYIQTVTVSLEIRRAADFELARSSRCAVETGDSNSMGVALEKATRCALEALYLW